MFYDIYCALCEKKGKSPSKVASEIGFNRASVTVWKNSGKPPKMELLTKIAEYFDVSTDFLLNGEESKQESIDENLELDENYIILSRGAKQLTPEQRKQMLEMAKIMFGEEFDGH